MDYKYILSFVTILATLLTACGSASNFSTTTSSDSSSGAVVTVAGGTSAIDGVSATLFSVSDAPTFSVTTGEADSLYVRAYAVCMAESSDCSTVAEEDWVCLYDESDDTSDCSASPSLADAEADFLDITSDPEFAVATSVPGGEYNCVRFTVCDQLVGVSTALEDECGETIDMDISSDGTAEVIQVYASTMGDSDTEDEDLGSAEVPIEINGAIFLEDDSEVTMTLLMWNDLDGGWTATYDDEDEDCEIGAPSMAVTVESL